MGRGLRRCALPLRQRRRAMDSRRPFGVRNSADGGRHRNRVQRSSTRTTHNLHAGTLDHIRRWANLAKALSPAAKVGAAPTRIPCPARILPDFSQSGGECEPWAHVANLTQIAETRVLHGFCATSCITPAPIPVTRLWTGCTRLKTRELQAVIFH